MAYDWTPTGSGAATTTAPSVVVRPRRPATRTPPHAGPPDEIEVAAVIDEFIEAVEDGRARNRSGRRYRPSAFRDLRGILKHHVARDLGHMRLRDVSRRHVQALVDRLVAEGLSRSRIRSVVSAVRALYGYAIEQGYVELSPATGLVIPGVEAPSWTDAASDEDRGSWSWTYDADEAFRERPPRGRTGRSDRDARRPSEHQPVALFPERILSFALRMVFAIFILIVIASMVGPA